MGYNKHKFKTLTFNPFFHFVFILEPGYGFVKNVHYDDFRVSLVYQNVNFVLVVEVFSVP